MGSSYFPVVLRVRYAETDQMGVVHHAVYPVWFEAARSELARACGLAYSEWERQGVLLMVSQLDCRYRKPVRYDQEVTVWVRAAELASRRVVFSYRVVREDGALAAEGETRHLIVSAASGRPMSLPASLRAVLQNVPLPAGGRSDSPS